MSYIALILLLLALLLWWLAGRSRKQAGLPGGRILYTDTRGWGQVLKPLYDPDTNLTGKPDYLVQKGGFIIPVEVKSGRAPEAPYDSHIFQLAAYCLLVEKEYHKRPPYGIIHYNDRDFAVDYTRELESSLHEWMITMHQDAGRTEVHRSHEESNRCLRCGFRNACDESLA